MAVRSARGPGWPVEPTSGLFQVRSSLRRVGSDADYTPAAEYETRRAKASRVGPAALQQLICDTTKVNTGAAETTRTDCTLNGSTCGTSCATWLTDIGQAVRQLGKPVILTFAHEPNAAGQYPWAQGDTGSCGSSPCTPAQWIAAWDAVQAQVDGNGAGQYASWMWAPNADTGGSTVSFTPWWPGGSHVSMVGLDGYPQSGPGWGLCNFQELFGRSFTEMKSLTSLPVFISETDLAPLSYW
jgi:hypothetical protein